MPEMRLVRKSRSPAQRDGDVLPAAPLFAMGSSLRVPESVVGCQRKPIERKGADMPVNLMEKQDGKILEVQVSGRLVREDYRQFVPRFEQLLQTHGKLRLLFEMSDFHGWDAEALWDDLKFDVKHFNDIERVAMVGETKWQQWMASFCRPFTSAKVRYFDKAQLAEAVAWLEGD